MNVNFRQGIIAYPPRNANAIIFNNYQINLGLNSTDQILLNMADGDADYLITLKSPVLGAWYNLTSDYWLYVQLDSLTAQVSYGKTTYKPLFGDVWPTLPEIDQHFFNTIDNRLYVWNGLSWVHVLRIFVGYINSGKFIPVKIGSQVGLNVSVNTTPIKFDNNLPVRRLRNNGTFEFLTEHSGKYTHKANIENVKFETLDYIDFSAANSLVAFKMIGYNSSPNQITYANSSTDIEAVGMISQSYSNGSAVSFKTSGMIQNKSWQFSQKPGTSLWLGMDGELSLTPPVYGFIQKIGYIVQKDIIFLDINRPIYINPVEVTTTPTPTVTPTPSSSQIVVTPTASPTVTPTITVTPTPAPTGEWIMMTNSPMSYDLVENMEVLSFDFDNDPSVIIDGIRLNVVGTTEMPVEDRPNSFGIRVSYRSGQFSYQVFREAYFEDGNNLSIGVEDMWSGIDLINDPGFWTSGLVQAQVGPLLAGFGLAESHYDITVELHVSPR